MLGAVTTESVCCLLIWGMLLPEALVGDRLATHSFQN